MIFLHNLEDPIDFSGVVRKYSVIWRKGIYGIVMVRMFSNVVKVSGDFLKMDVYLGSSMEGE